MDLQKIKEKQFVSNVEFLSDGSPVEGGFDHGVRDEAGRREHVAAEELGMFPPQILRLGTRRGDDSLRQKAGSLS